MIHFLKNNSFLYQVLSMPRQLKYRDSSNIFNTNNIKKRIAPDKLLKELILAGHSH